MQDRGFFRFSRDDTGSSPASKLAVQSSGLFCGFALNFDPDPRKSVRILEAAEWPEQLMINAVAVPPAELGCFPKREKWGSKAREKGLLWRQGSGEGVGIASGEHDEEGCNDRHFAIATIIKSLLLR